MSINKYVGHKAIVIDKTLGGEAIESKVILLHLLHEDRDQDYWRVRYVGDDDDTTYQRWINRENIIK